MIEKQKTQKKQKLSFKKVKVCTSSFNQEAKQPTLAQLILA